MACIFYSEEEKKQGTDGLKHPLPAANSMTLKQLLAKNPQIKDPDKIMAGQKINR